MYVYIGDFTEVRPDTEVQIQLISVHPHLLQYMFISLLTDLQGIQRWSFHINTAVNTCLDRPLLCEIPCCCKSREISSIVSSENQIKNKARNPNENKLH